MTEERGTYAAGKDYPEQVSLKRWEKASQVIQSIMFNSADQLNNDEFAALIVVQNEVIEPQLNGHLEARRQWWAGRMERHKEGRE